MKRVLFWIYVSLIIIYRVLVAFLFRNAIEIILTCFVYFNFYPGPRNFISFLIFFLLFEFAGFCGQKFGQLGAKQDPPHREKNNDDEMYTFLRRFANKNCQCANCRKRRGEI